MLLRPISLSSFGHFNNSIASPLLETTHFLGTHGTSSAHFTGTERKVQEIQTSWKSSPWRLVLTVTQT